jgi:hypothetical protein
LIKPCEYVFLIEDDGVDRAASPVLGKGLTLSHGWRTV